MQEDLSKRRPFKICKRKTFKLRKAEQGKRKNKREMGVGVTRCLSSNFFYRRCSAVGQRSGRLCCTSLSLSLSLFSQSAKTIVRTKDYSLLGVSIWYEHRSSSEASYSEACRCTTDWGWARTHWPWTSTIHNAGQCEANLTISYSTGCFSV